MSHLNDLDDPRKPSNGTLHDFREILVMAIAAVLSDCDSVEDIAFWARKKEDWLRRFLLLKNGIPSEDTFLRLFRALDPKPFETVFRRWVGGIVGALSGSIAVDGKTVRGSGAGGESALHLVSAFATELGIVLGQEKAARKSNELSAIPELLAALDLKGVLVSIDAQGCQKAIARQIPDRGGDYLLAVKRNQPTLYAALEAAFAGQQGIEATQVEKSHGRIVGQVASVLPAQGVVDPLTWHRCTTIGFVDAIRHVGDKTSDWERRYYISSRALGPKELAASVRAHWGIENRLHWVLDVSFREDGSMVRKDNAPQNLSLLKKIVLNLIRLDTHDKSKASLRLKRKGAAWDDDLRMKMLGLTPL